MSGVVLTGTLQQREKKKEEAEQEGEKDCPKFRNKKKANCSWRRQCSKQGSPR